MERFAFPELMDVAKAATGRSYAALMRSLAARAYCTEEAVKKWRKRDNFPTNLSAEDAYAGLFEGCGNAETLAQCLRAFSSERECPDLAGAISEEQGACRSSDSDEDRYRDLALELCRRALAGSQEEKEGRTARRALPGIVVEVDRAVSHGGGSRIACPASTETMGYFSGGFETHELYGALLDAAQARYLSFGRKNSKIFGDESHVPAIRDLLARRADGFDFRCLFLDPDADASVIGNAQDRSGFLDDLRYAIKRAATVIAEAGADPAEVCRLYRTRRQAALAVADDFAFYRPTEYDERMMPAHFTGRNFCYARVDGGVGKELLDAFERAWASARPLDAAM